VIPCARLDGDGRKAGARAAWLVPTSRALPWRPLLVVVPTLAAVLAIADVAGAGPAPPTLLGLAVALLAAAALLGLDDPARSLLAAVPTSLARRRAHRLVLLVPVLAVSTATLLAVAHRLDLVTATLTSGTASLAALVAWGLAAGRLVERWRPELVAPVAAGTPIAWVVAAAALPADSAVGDLVHTWSAQPWRWAATGAVAWLVAGHGDPC
jgi:hypothetical protein